MDKFRAVTAVAETDNVDCRSFKTNAVVTAAQPDRDACALKCIGLQQRYPDELIRQHALATLLTQLCISKLEITFDRMLGLRILLFWFD